MRKGLQSALDRLVIAMRALRRWSARQPLRFEAGFDARDLSRLGGRLEVVRDARGVAHIYAQQEDDLFLAVGYLQARERMLHLDFLRHLGSGRLAEWLGNLPVPVGARIPTATVIEIDRFVRPLGFEAEARRDLALLDAESRRCLEAFAHGVNDGLKRASASLPAEYAVLPVPRDWTAEDSFLCARAAAFVIALMPLENELAFHAVRREAGDALAQWLYPEAPWADRPAGSAGAEAAGDGPSVPGAMEGIGSNNWAVSGKRSASGKPIVCNDPHVPLLPAPTFWQHVHLACGDIDVQGGMYPGFPGFGFGHNRHLAFGITTAYRDAWDLVRIRRCSSDQTRYHVPDGTAPITRHHADIKARFGRTLHWQWERCDHGIIYPHWHRDGEPDLALRYVGCDHAAHFRGHRALMRAHNAATVDAAIADMAEGPFDYNLVYGLRTGRIGWEVLGRLPMRTHDGLFVREATDPAAQWTGFWRGDDRPRKINPRDGQIVTANSVTDPALYPRIATPVHAVSDYRQQRITRLLKGQPQHDVASMQALQTDVGSDFGVPLRDAMLPMLNAFSAGTPLQVSALGLLQAWDGGFDVDSCAAPLFLFTRRRLCARLSQVLLPPGLAERFAGGLRAMMRFDRLLLDPADVLHAVLHQQAGVALSALVAEAFESAVSFLETHHGADPAAWRWGSLQRVRIATVSGLLVPGAASDVAVDAAFGGEPNTISPALSIPTRDGRLRVFAGASSRFICDLAQSEGAWFSHSSGPSTDASTPYFASLGRDWAEQRYFWSALWPADAVPDVLERAIVSPADLVRPA